MGLNAKYIWWSWFVIGALGLNVSNYALAGVEAGILASKYQNMGVTQKDLHANKSWSTIGGWKDLAQCIWFERMPSVPWLVLFFLSVLSWAFVLSGLTMNTAPGFAVGHNVGVSVLGINETTMNVRTPVTVFNSAYERWRAGTEAQIPKLGALYTKPGSTLKTNVTTPNILPQDGGAKMFLIPQADVPLTGTSWGLQSKYSCIGIQELSEFTILNRRINSTSPAYISNYSKNSFPETTNEIGNVNFFYNLEDGSSINVLSQLLAKFRTTISTNGYGLAEIGLSSGFDAFFNNELSGYAADNSSSPAKPSYNGLEEVEVMEMLLWQSTAMDTVMSPIPDLETEHLDNSDRNMPAIGIRCSSSSVTGNAMINGLAGSFTDFVRLDPLASYLTDVPRFSQGAHAILIPGNMSTVPFGLYERPDSDVILLDLSASVNYTMDYDLVATDITFMQQLFVAAGMKNNQFATGFTSYDEPLQREDLIRAVAGAYKHYAVQVLFSGKDSPLDSWSHQNLTGAVERFVLVNGEGVPPLLVLICFLIWACGCVGLGLVYGTRRRADAVFDACKYHEHAN